MSRAEPTEQELIEQVYEFAAQQRSMGQSGPEIKQALVAEGLDEESASVVVENIEQMEREGARSAGTKNMIYGAIWCIGGTVVTVATYSAASGGGSYVVAWGAIIFGGVQFLQGLVQSFSS